MHPGWAGPGRRGWTKSGEYKGLASSVRSVPVQSTRSIAKQGQRPTTLCCPAMLLMLLTLSWLPSGGALSLAQEHLPAFPGPSEVHFSPKVSRLRELQKQYEDLLTRLQENQTWEDSNPDLIPATQVQILTPKRE